MCVRLLAPCALEKLIQILINLMLADILELNIYKNYTPKNN